MTKLFLFSALLSFALSFVFCKILLPLLRRWNAGQNILVYVREHKKKNGTPTMAGIAFITAAVLSTLIFIVGVRPQLPRSTMLCIAIGVSYMAIGFLDDYLKKRRKENLGLTPIQKFAFQSLVAIFCGIYCFQAKLTSLQIPFFNYAVDIGWWCIPLVFFLFLATVNAVNLTDGLDGLASGTSIPFFLSIGILICIQGEDRGIALLCFCLVGALLAYLCFNVSPASMFMGDTGSLALGGFASAVTAFTGNTLYVAVVGVCFVLSVISVLIQVIYYKVTDGKRVFLMAPIHHHFQKKGYSESKIAYAYFVVTFMIGCICIATAI